MGLDPSTRRRTPRVLTEERVWEIVNRSKESNRDLESPLRSVAAVESVDSTVIHSR